MNYREIKPYLKKKSLPKKTPQVECNHLGESLLPLLIIFTSSFVLVTKFFYISKTIIN